MIPNIRINFFIYCSLLYIVQNNILCISLSHPLLSCHIFFHNSPCTSSIHLLKYFHSKCENLPETFVDNQSKARDISSKFINYLIKNRTVFADATTYSVDGICAVDFPDYFAGKYINTDGKLIMQVTQDYYSAICGESCNT